MSRGAKVISALILVLAVAIAWPVSAHFQAKKKVANYKKQLQARGEKFSLEEIVPMPPPESQNGGPLLIAAASQFTAPSAYGSNYPPIMKNLGPGRAWVAWKQ